MKIAVMGYGTIGTGVVEVLEVNKDLIADRLDFEPQGADPWVTGESYLDEKRVDGGLM